MSVEVEDTQLLIAEDWLHPGSSTDSGALRRLRTQSIPTGSLMARCVTRLVSRSSRCRVGQY